MLLLQVMGALIVGTLVDGALSFLFPLVEGGVAVRAPKTGFAGAITAVNSRETRTDLTEQLAAAFTIVEVQVVGWGVTVQTTAALGNFPATATLNFR